MKTVVISGASRGIGAAAARLFAANGYTVAVNYCTDREGAEAVVRDITAAGGDAFAVCADVADAAAVERLVETVLQRCGRIDVLIHNAGVAQQALLTDTTPDEWRRMLGVHLDGAYHLAHALVPQMVSRHSGCILTVSSMWGEVGASCEVAYSAAKAGLIGFTKALAKELGPSGITVNCVTPGVIDTAMCAAFDEETRTALSEETPLGRLGTPEDVAEALLFLASERASFITGQVLGVNGGFVI
ncbi:MAG: 3-oxoacyl-ACP reductase FabG [Clostridia bacterium]|nr:3-oxoacyl-ACP reductase FabG [Clostridia bacterium]